MLRPCGVARFLLLLLILLLRLLFIGDWELGVGTWIAVFFVVRFFMFQPAQGILGP